jgi:hypothetical protein
MLGAGKTTYTFSANANILSANFPFSVLPAGGAGMGQAAEMESTLALAENVYITPLTVHLTENLKLWFNKFRCGRSSKPTTICPISKRPSF